MKAMVIVKTWKKYCWLGNWFNHIQIERAANDVDRKINIELINDSSVMEAEGSGVGVAEYTNIDVKISLNVWEMRGWYKNRK